MTERTLQQSGNFRLWSVWLGCLFAALFWTGVLAGPDMNKIIQLAQQRYGASAVQTVQLWRTLVHDVQGLSETEKLKRVNDFFNRRIEFNDDQVIWGQSDYWATPLETMGRGTGDCEDYAIAKYTTLKLLQVPIERMRMIYVRAQLGGGRGSQAHMVLGYYPSPDAEPVILDNLIPDIRPASQRTDLHPVFSFNGEGLWVGNTASPTRGTAGLSRWRDVITRMQADGFE